MKTYKVKLIKEYIKMADTKEDAIKSAKFTFDNSNDSSFCQEWDKVQCREYKAESVVNDKSIEQIDRIKNELADTGKNLRTMFEKYKAESEDKE